MARVKAVAPPNFKSHVVDAEKRLNILFEHLNEETLLRSETIEGMRSIVELVRERRWGEAETAFVELMKVRGEEGSAWMVSPHSRDLVLETTCDV